MNNTQPTFVRHKRGTPKPVGILSERAKSIFNEVVQAFSHSESCAKVDGPLITRYSTTLDDWISQAEKLRTEGYVIETGPHKTKVRNPRHSCVKALSEELARCEKALGFSPEARGKLSGYKLI